ncbi:unnamed protein product, partial [Urochloa humidicola]
AISILPVEPPPLPSVAIHHRPNSSFADPVDLLQQQDPPISVCGLALPLLGASATVFAVAVGIK